jgi:hypothetical protein
MHCCCCVKILYHIALHCLLACTPEDSRQLASLVNNFDTLAHSPRCCISAAHSMLPPHRLQRCN